MAESTHQNGCHMIPGHNDLQSVNL